MASKKSGLTKAQERELGCLYRNGEFIASDYDSKTTINLYDKLTELGYAEIHFHKYTNKYVLSERGRELAASIFGSGEPAPTPAAASVATVAEPTVRADGMVEFESHERLQAFFGIEPKQSMPKLWAKLQAIAAETCTCGEPLTVREEAERGFCVYCAYDYEKPTPAPQPPTKTTRFTGVGSKGIISGHNRQQKRTQSQKSAPVKRFKANKVSTIMMERNAQKQAQIRASYRSGYMIIPAPVIQLTDVLRFMPQKKVA